MQAIRSALPVLVLLLAGCEQATLPLKAGTGPAPTLPPPNHTLLPTVHIAPAIGWPLVAVALVTFLLLLTRPVVEATPRRDDRAG